MSKSELTSEQKRLDADIGILALVTLVCFRLYAIAGKWITGVVKDHAAPVLPQLLLNAAVQFGTAGLGITFVCIWNTL